MIFKKRSRRILSLWPLCIAMIVGSMDDVMAQSLPNAYYYGSTAVGALYGDNNLQNYSTTSGPIFSLNDASTGILGSYADGILDYNASTAPSVDVSSTATAPTPCAGCVTLGGAVSFANVGYSFEITGPTATVSVLIQANGGLHTSAGAGNDPESNVVGLIDLGIGGPGLTITDFAWTAAGATGNATLVGNSTIGWNGTIKENAVYTLQTNQRYDVSLEANVDAFSFAANNDDQYIGQYGYDGGIVASNSNFATGYVDPYFSIASGTANADQYAFLFSPGVVNSPISSVPEPATWALLVLGFAGIGFASFRKARQSAETAAA